MRSGLVITASRIKSEPGTISAATIGNAAEDGSAGTTTLARLELGLALQGNAAAVLAMRLAGELGAEMFEHAFGVVARGLRFDHRGLAGRRETRQQHRRFELRRRHRRFVGDRDRIGGPVQRERQPAALGGVSRARAHSLQRIEHALHRPLAQGSITVKRRGHRRTRHRADGEPHPGTRIAEIERADGLLKSADADAVNAP